ARPRPAMAAPPPPLNAIPAQRPRARRRVHWIRSEAHEALGAGVVRAYRPGRILRQFWSLPQPKSTKDLGLREAWTEAHLWARAWPAPTRPRPYQRAPLAPSVPQASPWRSGTAALSGRESLSTG